MLTSDELLKIARLSRLYIEPERLAALAEDMSAIVAFADTITAAEVAEAPAGGASGLDALRPDIVRTEPLDTDLILDLSRVRDGRYFAPEVRKL
jgi:Asp-tRNA(Asn)/Glu-tRNA(Gln) amidotransferase C subunit